VDALSTTESESKLSKQNKRRIFSPEFKAEAVRLVVEEGRSINDVANSLDLYHSSLANWVKQAKVNPVGIASPTPEQLELRELRKRVRKLEMEREILKKAAAFFAKENS
jgi:transposase